MAYYTALITQWGTLSGSTTVKLTTINAQITAGPVQDVLVSTMENYLSLRGLITVMNDWLATDPSTGAARTAAKEMLHDFASPHILIYRMSDPTTYGLITGYLNDLSATPPSLISPTNASDLTNFSVTTIPWWEANGYSSPINLNDLAAAGGLT